MLAGKIITGLVHGKPFIRSIWCYNDVGRSNVSTAPEIAIAVGPEVAEEHRHKTLSLVQRTVTLDRLQDTISHISYQSALSTRCLCR